MQAVIFCGHLHRHVLNPCSFLDGCRYLVEVLSLSVSRALPESVSPSLDPLVSHTSSLPVPQPSLLRLCSSLDLLCSFSIPLAACHGQHLCAAGRSSSVASVLISCLFYQMRPPCLDINAFLPLFCPLVISFPGRCFLRLAGFMHKRFFG